jgi:dTDP-4-amino-4,6-dideoxygalactose transaminase
LRISLFDPSATLEPLREQLNEAACGVLDSGIYVLGPQLAAFEEEFAAYLGARNVVGVGNGTDALTLALRALGVGPGDDVVVPSFTFYATVEAIPPTGARPVFCDIDLETFCATPQTVREALTPRTKAIVVVDLFGNVAPIPEISDLGLPVVEDAAQAAGARLNGRAAGTLGDVGTFSFYPSKNLGGFGDGGAVVTNDHEIADRVRLLRSHGSRDKSRYECVGYNSRLDELQAALLRVLLPELDGWVSARRRAAAWYAEHGLGELVELPRAAANADPAWHLYVVRHPHVEAVGEALAEAGIEQRRYYRTPVHRQPAMASYGTDRDLPATEEAARTHVAIPMHPRLSSDDTALIVRTVENARH